MGMFNLLRFETAKWNYWNFMFFNFKSHKYGKRRQIFRFQNPYNPHQQTKSKQQCRGRYKERTTGM